MKGANTPALPDHRILQQAAEWFATLADEEASEQDRVHWRAWLNGDPEHQRAWHYVERVGQRFQEAQQHAGQGGAGRILNATRARRLTRRNLLGGGLACAAAWLTWRHSPLPAATQRLAGVWTADQRTGVGESRQLALSDGGKLWLNTASAVDVDYSDRQRVITLRGGEILIQTAKDPRPFTVRTPYGNLLALGTRFTVQHRGDDVLLAVYEGAVRITTTSGSTRTLEAGQQTTYDGQTIAAAQPAQRARQAWASGLIVADDISLQELAGELSRYQRGHLGVDPALADLRVMGTYPADNPGHALAMLENALPLRVNRLLPWWVTLEPRG